MSELFEDAIDDAKKDVQKRGQRRVKRRLMRETRAEMEKLHAEFVDKMAEAMEAKIAGMVEAEVAAAADRWPRGRGIAVFRGTPERHGVKLPGVLTRAGGRLPGRPTGRPWPSGVTAASDRLPNVRR